MITKMIHHFALAVFFCGTIDTMPDEGRQHDQLKAIPSFTWSSSSSLHVVYPNGNEDDIGLRRVFHAGKPVECLFRGVFHRDNSNSAVISGCQHDEIVTITIIAKDLWGRTAFEVNNGFVEDVENPYVNKPDEDPDVEVSRVKRGGYENYVEYDYYEPQVDSSDVRVPKFLTSKIKLGYEKSLLQKFGNDHKAAKIYVREVAELASVYFQHFSPNTKIFLDIQDDIKFVDEKWAINGMDLDKAKKAKMKEAIPIIFTVATDDNNIDMGISPGGAGRACYDEEGASLVKHRSKKSIAAMTWSHELGHLYGLKHDHLAGDCHGSGLMSVLTEQLDPPLLDPEQRPPLFSTCSASRFATWFRNYGKVCLEEGITLGNGDFKTKYLEATCQSVLASPGETLHSGCSKPNELPKGTWMCDIDGTTCYAACIPSFKLQTSCHTSLIECVDNRWTEDTTKFICVPDCGYVSPGGKHHAFACQENIYVVGGYKSSSSLNSVNVFHTNLSQWSEGSPMPTARAHPAVAVLKNQLYAIGGWSSQRGNSKAVEIYNPISKQWTSNLPDYIGIRRSLPGAAVVAGQLYIVGGNNMKKELETVEKYVDSQWQGVASMAQRRDGPGVVELNGKLYAIGGYDGKEALNTVEVLDIGTGKWAYVASLTEPRYGPGAANLNGKIYVAGGRTNYGAYARTVEAYDPEQDEWKCVSSMVVARFRPALVSQGGNLWIFGGFGEDFVELSSFESYDPVLDAWTSIGAMKSCIGSVGAGVLLEQL